MEHAPGSHLSPPNLFASLHLVLYFVMTFRHFKISDISVQMRSPSSGWSWWEFSFGVKFQQTSQKLLTTRHITGQSAADPALVCFLTTLCRGFVFPGDNGNKTKNLDIFSMNKQRSTNASILRVSLSQETRPSRRRAGFFVDLFYSNVD